MKKDAVPAIVVVAVLLDVAVIAEAQPQAKVSKIGWLSARAASNSGQEVTLHGIRPSCVNAVPGWQALR
jgi:hypothetical protein